MSAPGTEIRFHDGIRAQHSLAKLTAAVPEAALTFIRVLLAGCPDPDGALDLLERFLERQPTAFRRIVADRSGLQYLITIFSYSRFLSEEVLQQPEWLEALVGSGDMFRMLTAEEMTERLEKALQPGVLSPLDLALFRRRKLLRIVLRDVLGLATISELTEELSNVADTLLQVTYQRIREDLIRRYGTPRFRDDSGQLVECGFSVIALGKLGGRGLNYSSDIDLMFVHAGNGETDGPEPVSNSEFFKKVAVQLTELLGTYTAEGRCYRIDLRLRPDGRTGEIRKLAEEARYAGVVKAHEEILRRDFEAKFIPGRHYDRN